MAGDKMRYTNGKVTVIWQPKLCMHSGNCIRGLPSVFDYAARPWINMSGATSEEIIAQVKKCPSGALSFEINEDVAE